MAAPPKYDDLGKESRDVFGKGYGKSGEEKKGSEPGWKKKKNKTFAS